MKEILYAINETSKFHIWSCGLLLRKIMEATDGDVEITNGKRKAFLRARIPLDLYDIFNLDIKPGDTIKIRVEDEKDEVVLMEIVEAFVKSEECERKNHQVTVKRGGKNE